jgi:hypothetical protein
MKSIKLFVLLFIVFIAFAVNVTGAFAALHNGKALYDHLTLIETEVSCEGIYVGGYLTDVELFGTQIRRVDTTTFQLRNILKSKYLDPWPVLESSYFTIHDDCKYIAKADSSQNISPYYFSFDPNQIPVGGGWIGLCSYGKESGEPNYYLFESFTFKVNTNSRPEINTVSAVYNKTNDCIDYYVIASDKNSDRMGYKVAVSGKISSIEMPPIGSIDTSGWDEGTYTVTFWVDDSYEYTTESVKLEILRNQIPHLSITTTSSNDTLSEVEGYNSFSLSGMVYDPDGDNVTISATIGGVTKSCEISPAPTTLPDESNWTLTWSGNEILEGIYSDVIVYAIDDKGGEGSVVYDNTLVVDKSPPTTPVISADITVPTKEDVTVTIDNWGDATARQYRVDGGAWQDYTDVLTISENCFIEAQGIDHVGNKSDIAALTVDYIFKSPVITQDDDFNYHLGLAGNLQTGWQYQIIITDDISGLEIINDTYPADSTDIVINKELLKDGYSFNVTENVLDTSSVVVFTNTAHIIKSIDHFEFLDPVTFLFTGQTQQYSIRAYYTDGSVNDNFTHINWTSNNPDFTIDAAGLVSVTSSGNAVLTATGFAPNDLMSVSLNVTSEVLTGYSISDDASPYIIAGDLIHYSINANLNPTVINNYTNVTWSVDDTSVATIDSSGTLSTHNSGTVIVTVTDKTLTSYSHSFSVNIHAAPTVEESLNNDFIITLAGDLTVELEYKLQIYDTATSAQIYNSILPRDTLTVTVPKNNLVEGHNYDVIVEILDSVVINSRTLNIVKSDTTAPVINRVYIDTGTLYVIAQDNVNINTLPYRYTMLSTASVPDVQAVITSADPFEMSLLIESDRDISSMNTSWIDINSIQPIKLQDKIKIEVRDASGNINTIEVLVNKTSGTLYGKKTPEEIAAEKPPQSPVIVSTEQEIEEEAKKALTSVVTISDEAPINSQTGQITVDLSSVVKSMGKGSLLQNCKYRLELYKKHTGFLLYSKILQDTAKIVIPDLDDATVYVVKVAIINNKGEDIASSSFETETADRTPPIIKSIRTTNGNLSVTAQDNKALASEAYKFEVVSSSILSAAAGYMDDQQVASMIAKSNHTMKLAAGWNLNTWTSNNTMEGVETNMVIKTVVRDSSGNTAEIITTVNSLDSDLVNLINADEPYILMPGTTGNISSYFLMGDSVTYTVSDPSIATIDTYGNITGLKNGQVTVTAKDNITGTIKQLLIKVKNLNTADVRRIIVEKDSITNLQVLYSDYLKNIFGTTDNLTWFVKDTSVAVISEDGALNAINYGITKVTATLGDSVFNMYVVVVKPGTVKSDIQQISVKTPYLLKKGDRLDLDNLSEFVNFRDETTAKGAFVVYESSDYNVLEVSGNNIIAKGEGLAEVIAFDLINNVIEKVKVRVEDMSPLDITYNDINNHWAKNAIEKSTELGITKGYGNGIFNPDQTITNNEFLIMMSRTMLVNDATSIQTRSETYKGLNSRSVFFNNHAYALNNVSSLFAYDVFGNQLNENKKITRGETAEIILSTTKGKLQKTGKSYNINDLNGSKHEDALRYCLETGIFVGYGDGSIKGDRELTRAEMLTVILRLYEKAFNQDELI